MIGIIHPKIIFCNFDQLEKIQEALDDVEHTAHFITFMDSNENTLHIDQIFDTPCDEDEYE